MALKFKLEQSVRAEGYDAIVLIASSLHDLKDKILRKALQAQADLDKSFLTTGGCVRVNYPAKRLIYAPTGPLDRDYDDVRSFGEAGKSGIIKGIAAGMKRPLVVIVAADKFPYEQVVGLLGVQFGAYVPIEVRESGPNCGPKLDCIGFIGDYRIARLVESLEAGRVVARDIGGSDPERMAPPKVEEYVRKCFENSSINIEVISDEAELNKSYPLFSAVNRCAAGIKRHQGRIIYLTYSGELGPCLYRTLMIVGKGVTYDTGGADIKAGGHMASMHRDKCGAAAVAGFMKIVDELRPKGLKVVAAMSMVRNSVGSNCYVSDEIITSRAGKRIRIGNTDAEGRMAMADVLCRMKELAESEINPQIMTIATLTGHCVLACGQPYTAVMDNGPAYIAEISETLQQAGDKIGDPFEISRIRREDYAFHKGKSEYEDILQSNNLPSSQTERGHQSPAAFLILSSGLDNHGNNSSLPIPYSHLDIAGSSGEFPGLPTGAPILAMTKAFIPEAFIF